MLTASASVRLPMVKILSHYTERKPWIPYKIPRVNSHQEREGDTGLA